MRSCILTATVFNNASFFHPFFLAPLALYRSRCEKKITYVNVPYAVERYFDVVHFDEFLYVDDLANLCVFLMNNYSGNETVNAGTGKEISIKELTELVAKVIGYEGKILWDTTKPNGTPRKLLDVSKTANMGWHYLTELEDGIKMAYEDFLRSPMRVER